MSKRPSPLTTARSRAYTKRLEQMLAESNIRLAAATEMVINTRDISADEANRLIDTYVDDWHYLNQERGEFPGVAVPEWVAERWAKSDAEAEASIKMKAANLGRFIAAERDQHMTDEERERRLRFVLARGADIAAQVAAEFAGQQ